MSTNNFIPEVWAASVLTNFHNQAVVTGLANRQYEGDLKVGNTVHIPGIVDVKVKDYKTGVIQGTSGKIARTTAPDRVETTGIDLTVDQEKSFDFLVDDIDEAQSKYSYDAYTQSASFGLVEDAETFLTTLLLTQGTTITDTTAPADATAARGKILGLRSALTRAKVPQTQRYVVLNASFEEILLSGDSKLLDADKSGTTDGLREATIGRLFGFDVLTSPYIDDTKPTAVALYTPALAYVSQINKSEAMRDQNSFSDRYRGLHVYGGKVLRPTAVQIFKAA